MATKVLMLLNAPYPADIRVKKEASALISAKYEVHLLCLRRNGEESDETFEGMHLHRINAGRNNIQLAFWDVIMSLTFVHPRFRNATAKIVSVNNIDLIHVHDLPLTGTALKVKKQLHSNVIIDLHENYPEALKTWFKWKKNPLVRLKNSLFMNPKRWTLLEQQACRQADHVIAVVDEMKARLVEAYSIPEEKITIVTNTEGKEFTNQILDKSVYESLPKGFVITYSGGIGPHRGVDTAIKGMSFLSHLPIQLAIVGFGSPSVMNNLRVLVASLNLKNVHFLGRQPFDKFYSYMHMANANVIPHRSNGHTDNTVPHKLFQGMMAARPLIVSSSAPLKRFVRQYDCGIVFEAGNEKDFADKVETLYQNESLQQQLSSNGYNASMHGNLNWESTQKNLLDLYQRAKSK